MKKAFTLIELLVVVLIIGILAAVAVPQYQRAVERARVSEALMNLKTLQSAIDLYVLENGFGFVDFRGKQELLSASVKEDTAIYHFNNISCQDNFCEIDIYRLDETGSDRNGKMYRISSGKYKGENKWRTTCEVEYFASTKIPEYICQMLNQEYFAS